MTDIHRILGPQVDRVKTIRLRVHDVLRETVTDMDGRWGVVREVLVTQPPQPAVVIYEGHSVAAWMITGEAKTVEGQPYVVRRVATAHQEWAVMRP